MSCHAGRADNSHAAHGAVTTLVSLATCSPFKDKNPPVAAIIGISAAMMLGHIKENRDVYYDKSDMVANAGGALLGTMLCLSF